MTFFVSDDSQPRVLRSEVEFDLERSKLGPKYFALISNSEKKQEFAEINETLQTRTAEGTQALVRILGRDGWTVIWESTP